MTSSSRGTTAAVIILLRQSLGFVSTLDPPRRARVLRCMSLLIKGINDTSMYTMTV